MLFNLAPKILNCQAYLSLAITLTTFFIFLPALNNNFINWDDDLYVYRNPNIQSIDIHFLKWAFTSEVASLWHPLTLFTHAVTYFFWGLEPIGHHLINNILHSLNALLVFLITIQLIKCCIPDNKKINVQIIFPAFIIALLFGIHPLRVESVVWISERKDVLCAFFFLISLHFYLKFASSINSKRTFYYVVCLISFGLALMSKPMAVSLPLVLLIFDIYPLKRFSAEYSDVKISFIEKTPFFILSLFCSLLTIWASHSGKALWTMKPVSAATHIAVAAFSYIIYLIKIALPFNLAPLYPQPLEINFFRDSYWISMTFFLLITAIIIKLKKNKLFLTVWLYYIITLIPVIGIVQAGEQIAADRYTYLPSLGPFLLVGLGITHLYKTFQTSNKLLIILLLFVVIGIMSYKTIKQIDVWRDSVSLWSHEIKIFPDKVYVAYSGRGAAYAELGELDMALRDLDMAVKLSPTTANAYFNRGTLFHKRGEYYRSIKDLNKAIELDPKYIDAYINRGIVKHDVGQYAQAIHDYNSAIQLNPGIASLYFNRGNAHLSIGKYDSAIWDYKKALELNPKLAQAHYNLGIVYYKLGDLQKAESFQKKAANIGLR